MKKYRNKALGVKQLTPEGEPIATYPSQKAAAIATNICRNEISLAVNGHKDTAGGYLWAAFELPREDYKYIRDEMLRKEAEEYLSIVNKDDVAKERSCLLCGKIFMSKSNRNRRCGACTEKEARYGQRIYHLPTETAYCRTATFAMDRQLLAVNH